LIKEKTVHPASSSFRIVAKFTWGNFLRYGNRLCQSILRSSEKETEMPCWGMSLATNWSTTLPCYWVLYKKLLPQESVGVKDGQCSSVTRTCVRVFFCCVNKTLLVAGWRDNLMDGWLCRFGLAESAKMEDGL